MPNRIIRESIRTSPTLNQITAEAHRLWSHLVTVADDEGRFLSDAGIVLANCFPLKIGILRVGAVERWLLELDRAGLILLYYSEKKDRRYGQFVTWKTWNPRCRYGSKWPAPPERVDPAGINGSTVEVKPNGNHAESAPISANGAPTANRGAPLTSSSIHHLLSSKHTREKSRREPQPVLSDQDWFDSLRHKPKYAHINFDYEDKEMDKWLVKHPGRTKSRRFITNWLDKVDLPVKLVRTVHKIHTKPRSFTRMQEAEAAMRKQE
jgi:hypothetical protein